MTTSGRRPCRRFGGSRRAGTRRPAGALALALAVAAAACGGGDAEREAGQRAELEAEFGRRVASGGPAEGTVAGEPAGGRPPEAEARTARGQRAGPSDDPAPGAARTQPPPTPTPPRRDDSEPDAPPAVSEPEPAPDSMASDPAAEARPAGADPDSLLALADRAYAGLSSLRAAFTQRIENPLLGRTNIGSGTWYQAGRGRFRMDFEDPPDDVIVADGTCMWAYEPSVHEGQIIASRLDEGAEIGTVDILGQLLARARTGYDGVYAGAEEVGQIATHHVALTPREPSRYVEIDLWIGAADHLVRRFRLREENELVRTVTLSRLEPQTPLADSLFTFTPPAGASIFPADARCG